jgi:hypothetical protein
MTAAALRPVRTYHYVRTRKEGGGYDYPREVQHERALFHTFGPESTEGSEDVVHGMVAVVELPDGAVITVAAHMIEFLDAGEQATPEKRGLTAVPVVPIDKVVPYIAALNAARESGDDDQTARDKALRAIQHQGPDHAQPNPHY